MSRLTAMEKALRADRSRARSTTSAETAARYQVARHRKDRKQAANPVYATDGIEIPRRKRRVLLDLAPISVEILLAAIRRSEVKLAVERVLVEALEKAR